MPELPRAARPRLGSGPASEGTNGNAQPRASPAGPGPPGSRAAAAPPPHPKMARARKRAPRDAERAGAALAAALPPAPARPAPSAPPRRDRELSQVTGRGPGRAGGRGDKGRVPRAGRRSWRALSGRAPLSGRLGGKEGRAAWRPQGGATAASRSSRCPRRPRAGAAGAGAGGPAGPVSGRSWRLSPAAQRGRPAGCERSPGALLCRPRAGAAAARALQPLRDPCPFPRGCGILPVVRCWGKQQVIVDLRGFLPLFRFRCPQRRQSCPLCRSAVLGSSIPEREMEVQWRAVELRV